MPKQEALWALQPGRAAMATPRQPKSLNFLLRKILCRGGLKNRSCYLAISPPYNSYFVPPSPANSPPETKKTKVVIFQKRAKKFTESIFNMDKQTIEILQNYTYLGTLISSLGNFSLAHDQLKEKALHALFSLRKHTKYSIQRDEFYKKVQFYVHNIKQLPPIEAIKELMNSSNYFVNLQVMNFVLSCFDLRSKLLSI